MLVTGRLALAGALLLAASTSVGAQSVSFLIEETLTLPTARSVMLSLVPLEEAELLVEYGAADGSWTRQTPVESVGAGEPAAFLLAGFKPGHEYRYRVSARAAGTADPFEPRDEETFRTLRRPGDTVTFAYTADAHLYDNWAKATFGDSTSGYEHAVKSFGNLAADESLDFFVLAGDHASTHCHNCPGGVEDGFVYQHDYALLPEQGLARYHKLLSPEHVGRAARTTPFVWVLGNHEGETADTMVGCGHSELNAFVSRSARQQLLPDPWPFFGGNDRGTYYSFETGDALVVILDVMGYSAALPVNADGWSLGGEQLAWLEKVLEVSDRRWTFVIAEHLVGGAQVGLVQCYHYGRGGIRATQTTGLQADFLGEQQVVQEILARHVAPGGATFFMTGHDHVAMLPQEKPDATGAGTGVHYLKAGSIGAAPGWWKNDAKFQKQMDWDFDGTADYLGDVTGTDQRGYWRITVEGDERVVFDYVRTYLWNESINGAVLLSRTIEAR